MSKQSTHIDDIMKQLGDHRSGGAEDSKAIFMKKAAKHSFFRFYPGRFNLYYLIASIVLISGITILVISSVNKPSPRYRENITNKISEHKYQEIQEQTNEIPEQTRNLPGINETPGYQAGSTEIQTPFPGTKQTDKPVSDIPENLPDETVQNKNNEIPNTPETDNNNTTNSIPPPVVYDTVYVQQRVEIKDTVTLNIKDTVKIKRKHGRRHR